MFADQKESLMTTGASPHNTHAPHKLAEQDPAAGSQSQTTAQGKRRNGAVDRRALPPAPRRLSFRRRGSNTGDASGDAGRSDGIGISPPSQRRLQGQPGDRPRSPGGSPAARAVPEGLLRGLHRFLPALRLQEEKNT